MTVDGALLRSANADKSKQIHSVTSTFFNCDLPTFFSISVKMGGKPIGEDLKEAILSYYQRYLEENKCAPSFEAMSKIFCVKRNTIFYMISKFKKTGSVANQPKGHKKRSTTKRQDRQIILDVKRDPFISAT